MLGRRSKAELDPFQSTVLEHCGRSLSKYVEGFSQPPMLIAITIDLWALF